MNELSLHSIDYATFQGNALFHATVTDFDGIAQLTWSYDSPNGRKQNSKAMTREDWESLWNGLVDSALIKQYTVHDGSVAIDPFGFHVIGFASQDGAIPAIGVVQVPANEDTSEFTNWLRQLNPPDTFKIPA